MKKEGDYILGTNDEELERLGLQHRVWRSVVLNCWQNAGITVGSKVIDIGAGPGYATIDLAGIVGPQGSVTAVERSTRYVAALRARCDQHQVDNVDIHELDLMANELPVTGRDFSWCRWVASFVSDRTLLVRKIAAALRPGGRAIFHEYGHYRTWRLSPRLPLLEEFVELIMQSWRETGGEPDVALELPSLLEKSGFSIRSVTPQIFCVRPGDFMWQWPAAFIQSGPARLQELGKIDQAFVDKLRAGVDEAARNENSFFVTPLVLEIVAEKRGES
jgi:SAM-dependent methyltransferase